MMRKSLWFVPVLLLFAAIGAPKADADGTYAISFSSSPPNPAPTVVGSDLLTYSSIDNEFIPSIVEVDLFGNDYILGETLFMADEDPGPANPLGAPVYDWGCFTSVPSEVTFCQITDETTDENIFYVSSSTLPTLPECAPTLGCGGPVTLTAQTSEPATTVLMLLGFGLVVVMRRRIAHELRSSQNT